MSKPPHRERGRPPQVQQSPQQPPQQQSSTLVGASWQGPLPPPAALEKFNQLIPNGADRILKMAESEQQFRQQYEKEGLEATVREARRGQYLGAAICFAAVIGAAFSAYVGAHWAVSAALVGVPVLGMVLAVIRPRSKD